MHKCTFLKQNLPNLFHNYFLMHSDVHTCKRPSWKLLFFKSPALRNTGPHFDKICSTLASVSMKIKNTFVTLDGLIMWFKVVSDCVIYDHFLSALSWEGEKYSKRWDKLSVPQRFGFKPLQRSSPQFPLVCFTHLLCIASYVHIKKKKNKIEMWCTVFPQSSSFKFWPSFPKLFTGSLPDGCVRWFQRIQEKVPSGEPG